ncbi:MAG: hypothetical protein Q4A21_02625 [bacterium]|nr:hypothetical protein [bacterium]
MIHLLTKLIISILNWINIGGIFESTTLVAGTTTFIAIAALISAYYIREINIISFFGRNGWRMSFFLIGLSLQIPNNFLLWILGGLIIATQVFISKFIDKNRGKKGFLAKVKRLWEEIQKEDEAKA